MSRVRQFSSERKQSGLILSRSSGFNQNSPINNISFKAEDRSQRRQKQKQKSGSGNNSLKDSRILRSSRTSTTSQYICVGCFNQKLCSQSKQKRRLSKKKQIQAEQNSLRLTKQQQQIKRNQKLMQQAKKMNEYNLLKIEEKQRENQMILKQKQRMNQNFKKEEKQEYKRNQQRIKKENELRQNFKKAIQIQIQQKHNQQRLEKQQDRKKPISYFDNYRNSYEEVRKEKQKQFREEIEKQIKSNAQRRNQQLYRQRVQNEKMMGIVVQDAYARQIEKKKQLQKRKQELLNEAKARSNLVKNQFQTSLKEKQKLRVHEEQQQRQLQSWFQHQKQEHAKKMQKYISDLKQQISFQNQRKNKLVQADKNATGATLDFQQVKKPQKNCKSCSKKYPTTFLTKIK